MRSLIDAFLRKAVGVIALTGSSAGCTSDALPQSGSTSASSGGSSNGRSPMLGVGTPAEARVVVTTSATTLCDGECADIRAVVTGGTGRYDYSWNEGLPASAGPFHVCPDRSTVYTVTVREVSGAEIQSRQSVTASVGVTVGGLCANPSSPGAGGASASRDASSGSPGAPPAEGAGGGASSGGSPPIVDGGEPPPGVLDPRCRARFRLTPGGHTVGPLQIGSGSHPTSNVATDASGNIVIAGSFDGKIDTGVTVLDSGDANFAAFVVKLDAACRPAWARSYGSTDAQLYSGPVAVDSQGGPVLGGSVLAASIDFGTGPLSGSGTYVNAYLLKLRPDGSTGFAKVYPSTGGQTVDAVAVDLTDNIVLMGGGFGTSFGGPVIDGNLGAGYVVRLKADATHVWTRTGPRNSTFDTLCASRRGFIYLIGQTRTWLQGLATFKDALGNDDSTTYMTAFNENGNQTFTTSMQSTRVVNWGVTCGVTPTESAEVAYGHGADAMAVRGLRMVSPDGTSTPIDEWGVQGELSQAGLLVVDGARNALEVGTMMSPIHVSGHTITPSPSSNGGYESDVYVVKRDPDGVVLSAARVGASFPFLLGAAVDADLNLVVDYAETNPDGSLTITVAKYGP